MADKKFIVTEFIGKVGLVKLNRPESYNSLNLQVLTELMESLKAQFAGPDRANGIPERIG